MFLNDEKYFDKKLDMTTNYNNEKLEEEKRKKMETVIWDLDLNLDSNSGKMTFNCEGDVEEEWLKYNTDPASVTKYKIADPLVTLWFDTTFKKMSLHATFHATTASRLRVLL